MKLENDGMNLVFSYSRDEDLTFEEYSGMLLLGAAKDNEGKEVHIWLKKGCELSTPQHIGYITTEGDE